MILIDENALETCRSRRRCEVCGRVGPVEAHHILSKGAGRVDIDENLIALDSSCHSAHHFGGVPATAYLLEQVSERTGSPPDAILRAVYRIRQLPKDDREGVQQVLHSLPGRQGPPHPRERQDRPLPDPEAQPPPVHRDPGGPPAESGWRRF